jgi:hypothetical protein
LPIGGRLELVNAIVFAQMVWCNDLNKDLKKRIVVFVGGYVRLIIILIIIFYFLYICYVLIVDHFFSFFFFFIFFLFFIIIIIRDTYNHTAADAHRLGLWMKKSDIAFDAVNFGHQSSDKRHLLETLVAAAENDRHSRILHVEPHMSVSRVLARWFIIISFS